MLQKLHSLIYLISVKKKKKKESVNLYQLITPKSFTVCFEVAVRKKYYFMVNWISMTFMKTCLQALCKWAILCRH